MLRVKIKKNGITLEEKEIPVGLKEDEKSSKVKPKRKPSKIDSEVEETTESTS